MLHYADIFFNILYCPSDTVIAYLLFFSDFCHWQGVNEKFPCDFQLNRAEPVAVSQAQYKIAVHKSFCDFVNSPADSALAYAGKLCYLAKAVRVLQVHRHKDPVGAGKKLNSVSQQIDSVSI